MECLTCGKPLINTDYYCDLRCAGENLMREIREQHRNNIEMFEGMIEDLDLFEENLEADERRIEIENNNESLTSNPYGL